MSDRAAEDKGGQEATSSWRQRAWFVCRHDGAPTVCRAYGLGHESLKEGPLNGAVAILFVALQNLVERCGCGGTGMIDVEVEQEPYEVTVPCTDPDCEAARAALAKARGES